MLNLEPWISQMEIAISEMEIEQGLIIFPIWKQYIFSSISDLEMTVSCIYFRIRNDSF